MTDDTRNAAPLLEVRDLSVDFGSGDKAVHYPVQLVVEYQYLIPQQLSAPVSPDDWVTGEDVILHKLFGSKFANGFYIDVGAHHPFRQSNTAYLWLLGWNGVNVDASRKAIDLFRKVRPGDENVWTAVVDEATAAKQTEITLHSNQEVQKDLLTTRR